MEPVVAVLQPGRQALYLLIRAPVVIGRECDGLLIDDKQVSRRHVELRAENGTVIATDLGSSNGTFLDGVQLDAPAALLPGRELTFGTTVVRLDARPASHADVGRRTVIVPPSTPVDLRRTSIDIVADLATSGDDGGWHGESDTLTILFSDIEAHTERVVGMGDAAWFGLLEAHNQIFRDVLAQTRGREIKAEGDGFMLAFTSARRALTFATTVQRRLADHSASHQSGEIRVRMGLHTGEAITDGSGDLFGRHVIKAARIANLAAGGQILVSGTTREIATGDNALSFGDGLAVELKGLDGLHPIHEVFWDAV